tara:strand:- start:1133 stop:1861 length:729 start_codon:yes stop_codon:yes gene_type:complete
MTRKIKILLIVLLSLLTLGIVLFFVLKKGGLKNILSKNQYRGSIKPNEYKNIPAEGRPFNNDELELINDPKYKRVYDKALEMGYRFTYEVPNANMEYIDGKMVTRNTKNAFEKMRNDLEIDTGQEIFIGSGYRSVKRQYNILKSNLPYPYTDQDILEYLDGKSYHGTSTHHTGRAIDICVKGDSFSKCLQPSYWINGNGQKSYAWLKDNAKNYGFQLTYPENAKELNIGAEFEPWHWEYMGN